MKEKYSHVKNIPLDIVGSSTYGRDPKILASRTFNMIIADDFLIDCYGYKSILNISDTSKGRGIFTSVRGNFLLVVIGNKVYSVSVFTSPLDGQKSYSYKFVNSISSHSGNVFIDENESAQIAICDQHSLYIYNYVTNAFTTATLPEGFVPGYVVYQNGRFVVPNTAGNQFALSAPGNGLNWFWGVSSSPVLGALQTKPDFIQACVRMPGGGNILLVMGKTVTEIWSDVGAARFPYQRSYTTNIDYGCANSATIAFSDKFIAWLGINEKSGPVIMYSSGGPPEQISTDGINFRLGRIKFPDKSVGTMIKLDGHLIYQLTFYDELDNLTIAYDFTTGKFFDLTDENMDFHINRHAAFIDNEYYFVSINNGDLFKLNSEYYTYDYGLRDEDDRIVHEIPRIRVCSNIRIDNQARFIINNITSTIEQGNDLNNVGNDDEYHPRIALSISKDGGLSFSGYSTRPVYRIGRRMNRLNWWGLGMANDCVPQFRFWGKGPWRIANGVVSIY